MKKNISKIFVLSVIALFIALSFIPSINAAENIKEADLTKIEVTNYNPDGSTTTEIISIEKSDMEILKNKLINTNSLEERLEVLKEFSIISKDQSTDDLYQGMLKKAEKIGLEKSLSIPKFRPPIVASLFNKVTSVSVGGFSTRIGVTPLIKIINIILKLNLPRLDIIDTTTALVGILNVNNPISKHTMVSALGFFGHVGFVGTSIKFPVALHIFSGFSVLTFGMGIGIHIKNRNLGPDLDN